MRVEKREETQPRRASEPKAAPALPGSPLRQSLRGLDFDQQVQMLSASGDGSERAGRGHDLHAAAHERAHVVKPRAGARAVQRKPGVMPSASLSGDGIEVSISLPNVQGKLGYITIGNPSVTVTAVPTTKTEAEVDTHESEAGLEVGGTDTSIARDKGGGVSAGDGEGDAKVKAALAHQWGQSPVFTDLMGEVGTDGGSVSLSAGGEWKNAVAKVDFTLLSIGGQGKDVKFLTAEASLMGRGVITVDGVNFACTATLKVDVKPNSTAIARFLVEKGVVAGMRGFGEAASELAGLPFVFVEGAYETLKGLYKSVEASKDLPIFMDAASKLAGEAGTGFVRGALGNVSGLGGRSGYQWAMAAYARAKADNPEMTEAQFRQALMTSTAWQEDAKAKIANQVLGVIYRSFAAEHSEMAEGHQLAMLRNAWFEGGPPPDGAQGLGLQVPEIVDYSKQKKEKGPYDELTKQQKADIQAAEKKTAGGVKGRLDGARDSAQVKGGKLFAWLQSGRGQNGLDAHNRGMEFFRRGQADKARAEAGGSDEALNADGSVALQSFAEAVRCFDEGLALYPPGWPPKKQ